jgi:glycogen debranching enzyme
MTTQRTLPSGQHIPIDATHIDPETLVLNHGDSFGVFDRWGDIVNVGGRLQGVFHCGSRYISHLEVRIFDVRPLLLSSTVSEDNDVLSVDLTNPRIRQASLELDESMIHLHRQKFISHGVVFERLRFHNYLVEPIEVPVALSVAADFHDIFQERGFTRRAQMGHIDYVTVDDRTLEIRYEGMDGILRICRLRCSEAFEHLPPNELRLTLTLTLAPQQHVDLYVDIQLIADGHGDAAPEGEPPLRMLQREIAEQKDRIAGITTSNDQFNRWMLRSRTDLVALLARKDNGYYPYAGVPWYNSVFGRDGLITGMQTLLIAPWIARDVLLHLARLQASEAEAADSALDAEPGKILHELREGELVNLGELPFKKYYGSADSTPLFIWLAGLYANRTGDQETIDRLWPHLERAMRWIDHHSGYSSSGFGTYLCHSEKGLRNQGWKDSHDAVFDEHGELVTGPIALCEVQGYIYQAKVQMARLATDRGEYDRRDTLLREAADLRTRFNQLFWDTELDFFVMALDGDARPCRVISSNPGHCLAAGIVDADKAQRMAARFMQEDLNSGWGIRTLSSRERRYNPMSYHNGAVWAHDTSLVATGLARYGCKDAAVSILQSLFDATLFLNLQRIPELFCGLPRRPGEGPTEYPVACAPQAWAVCAGFMMVESALGIRIIAQRREIQLENPCLGFLSELCLRDLWLSPHERVSLRFVNYQSGVAVEVIDKPARWNVIVRK